MSETEREWDVIVIGSGLGGLTAAARLSKSGLRVLVLEQHVFAGGYAHHFLRKVRGTKVVYDFDVALHQTGDLVPGRGTYRILQGLGVLERISLNQFEIAYRTHGPAHDLQIPASADEYEQLLRTTFPEHANGVRDLFATLRKIDGGSGPEISPEAGESMSLTLQELIEQHVKDERITAIFSTLWGYVGLVPSQLSAFAYVMMWCSFHMGGCFYIKGGGQALSNAFVEVIEENGGKVLLRAEVTSIITEAGRVSGVETKGRGLFRAPIVVSNASAPDTFEHLLDQPQIAEADREVVGALPLACSIHQAYIGIRGDASKLGLADRGAFYNSTYDFDAEWRALERGDYRNQGWLIGNHDLADPGHAPPGRSILHVATMADGRLWSNLDDSTYRERKRDLQEYFIDRAAEQIPDIRDRIEICETGTPHTMSRYSMNPLGTIYGYAFTPTSHSVHRPRPRTGIPGLYLAGAWTFPAAGFGGTMRSGHHTAGLIFEEIEGMRDDARETL
jgi:phytoene dehydrogenase-like protein